MNEVLEYIKESRALLSKQASMIAELERNVAFLSAQRSDLLKQASDFEKDLALRLAAEGYDPDSVSKALMNKNAELLLKKEASVDDDVNDWGDLDDRASAVSQELRSSDRVLYQRLGLI